MSWKCAVKGHRQVVLGRPFGANVWNSGMRARIVPRIASGNSVEWTVVAEAAASAPAVSLVTILARACASRNAWTSSAVPMAAAALAVPAPVARCATIWASASACRSAQTNSAVMMAVAVPAADAHPVTSVPPTVFAWTNQTPAGMASARYGTVKTVRAVRLIAAPAA